MRAQPLDERVEHTVVVHDFHNGVRSNQEQDNLTRLVDVFDDDVRGDIIIDLPNQLIIGIAHQV